MAFTRSGAPAPTSSVSNAQALANRSVQNANRAGSTAMQAASPSVPVEITAADGQHLVVSFDEGRRLRTSQSTFQGEYITQRHHTHTAVRQKER